MRVAEIVESSRIYGPGSRTVLWLQGCSIQCEGCWNDELWSFSGGRKMSSEEIIQILQNNTDVGLTLLGGEPLDQAPAVLELIENCHTSGFDVMLYTGYELEELSKVQKQCVEQSDIVIHGRYVEDLRSENLLWRGSTNQDILINSQKYHDLELEERRQMEIHIDELGQVKVIGYPPEALIESIQSTNGPLKSLKRGEEL
jgi:anaerobic ribonucleoside-triphosphate reductase activating protein